MVEDQKNDASRFSVTENFRRLRRRVHEALIQSIETEDADVLSDRDEVHQRINWMLDEISSEQETEVSDLDRQRLEQEILEELGGSGPLAPLMMDPDVSDILINGPDEVWVDRFGKLEKSQVRFDDEGHLRRIVDRMVAAQGRHLDTGSPMVDARLKDGSRLHAIIPPLCARGTIVSIRRFRVQPFTPDELVETGFINQAMLDLLHLLVAARVNIVVSGSAATGKTTLLNMISRFIPEDERVVTIEETAELRLEHPHVIPLESRPANAEGRGGVGLRELVKNALRMRADRIIVGEVRGAEVFDMLQAMNVGHDGSLTTVHANSPDDVLPRLETLVMMGDVAMSPEAIRRMIGSAINIIVHLVRFRDGSRRVTSIREVVQQDDDLQTREIFRFQAGGMDASGHMTGQHVAVHGDIQILERIRQQGVDVGPVLESLAASAGGGD